MKILHLIGGLGVGGAEMMLFKLLSRLDRGRFDNRVVVMGETGPVGAKIAGLGVPMSSLGMNGSAFAAAGLFRLAALLRRERPDLVHAWMYNAAFAAALPGMLPGKSALAWNLRCSDMDDSRYSRRAAWVKRACAFLSGRPDVVAVNSESGRRHHELIGFRPKRWRVIPNGFDVSLFRPDAGARARVRRSWGVGEETFVIGVAARFDPMKDHETFCAATATLLKKHPGVRFVFCGAGTDDAVFVSLLERHCLREVSFPLGVLEDMPAFYAALDAAVLSSAFGEGFPNALGEAMACGVPCLATDVGDCRAIVGPSGFVSPPRDAAALAGNMDEILSMSPRRRIFLGELARERVETRYSLDAVAETYAGFYEETVRRKRGGSCAA